MPFFSLAAARSLFNRTISSVYSYMRKRHYSEVCMVHVYGCKLTPIVSAPDPNQPQHRSLPCSIIRAGVGWDQDLKTN